MSSCMSPILIGEHVVKHNYHDHADDHSSQYCDDFPCRGGVTTLFPIKLYEMLDHIDDDGYGDVISWQPHGRCFVVHKPRKFIELLPKYFKISKIASFIRQLNLYGFSRLTQGRDKGGYYHELFLRDRKFLANRIHRIKVKGTVRARSNPRAEPNFWDMIWVASRCNASTQNFLREKTVTCDDRIISSENNSFLYSDNTSSNGSMPGGYGHSSLETKLRSLTPKSVSIITNTSTVVPGKDTSSFRHAFDEVILSFGGNPFHYLDPSDFSEDEYRLLDFSCDPISVKED